MHVYGNGDVSSHQSAQTIPETSTNIANVATLQFHTAFFRYSAMPISRIRSNPSFLGVTPEKVLRLSPNVVAWGVAAGVGVLFFANGVPIFQRDILQNIPVLGSYWKKDEKPAAESE